jgi:hypothetical protein
MSDGIMINHGCRCFFNTQMLREEDERMTYHAAAERLGRKRLQL